MSDASTLPALAGRAAATSSSIARRLAALSDRALAWILIAPALVLLFAFNVVPLVWLVGLSITDFSTSPAAAPAGRFGWANYSTVLSSAEIWKAARATGHLVFWTVTIQTSLGFALAFLLDRRFRGYGLLTVIILIPIMLSPALVGAFWRALFEPGIGLAGQVIASLTRADQKLDMLGSASLARWAVIIVDSWMWTPFVMLICLAGLRSIPDGMYEAAAIDGLSKWRQFRLITLPLALPFIGLAALFRAIENLKMFDLAYVLTAAGPGPGLPSTMLKQTAFDMWRTGFSSAFAIILVIAVFGLAQVYARALDQVGRR